MTAATKDVDNVGKMSDVQYGGNLSVRKCLDDPAAVFSHMVCQFEDCVKKCPQDTSPHLPHTILYSSSTNHLITRSNALMVLMQPE